MCERAYERASVRARVAREGSERASEGARDGENRLKRTRACMSVRYEPSRSLRARRLAAQERR
eukprot:1639227-Pleurochrysis_carterae.AAC.1